MRLKAIGGGGGKGQRIVPLGQAERTPELVREILNEVKATGVGDNKNVLVELNIETTRHQEIQVIGNGDWCITLGGRDCSLQMHEQKLLEVSVTRESLQAAEARATQAGAADEAAVLVQDVKTLDAMEAEAARFGEAVGLDSVSTFECIVDRDQHFFMEMNTRIQVEHPVTERITNVDLVQEQIRVAAGAPLSMKQEDISVLGHAIECRINAEDPDNFMPCPGLVEEFHAPGGPGIRVDSHIYDGYRVPPNYDSMIAKIIAHGSDRETAIARMKVALEELVINGIKTNVPLHRWLLMDKGFLEGGFNIHYLEKRLEERSEA